MRLVVLCLPFAAAACVNVEVPSGVHEDVEIGTLTLEGDALTDELTSSPVREAPEPFVRIGLLWDADGPDALEVAASVDGTTWTDWTAPIVQHVEVEHTSNFVGQVDFGFGLDTPAKYYRLRLGPGATATFLRMELLATPMTDSVEDGGAPQVPHKLVGDATVHNRSDWGARAATCSSSLGSPYRLTIHHTETPTNDSMSPAARLRQIQAYHMDVKGWCDIGYHYLMSRDGQLWEGRPDTLLGAHAGGNNTGNIGIAVMGSHDTTPITDAQLHSIATLIKGLHDTKGITLDRSHVKGHREYNPTTCPGDALLDQIDVILDIARGAPDPDPDPMGGMCSLPTDGPWACSGLTGSTTNASQGYFTTSFGCWVDSSGNNHSDAGDNCIPACTLSSVGCSGLSGPSCERHHNWYAADADRFGCGTKIQVTNPDNDKSAVLIVIDRGPNCSIENTVDYWVLDMSYPASNFLFGGPTSATEHADVQIVVVDPSTPVGPTTAIASCDGTDPPPPPPTGEVTVLGVLYAGGDTANRIAGATVTFGDGRTVTTSPTGLWSFDHVPTGAFSVTAAAAGYQTRTITGTTYAPESWASFGLSPVAPTTGTAILQGVIYHTTDSSHRIANAQVTLSTGQTLTADGNGYYHVTNLPAGDITITASAPGYTTGSVVRTLVDGETEWGSVRLEP